jgi:membrane protease YdiL (CAAX protease family)
MDARERLDGRDYALLAICVALFAGSLFIILNWFSDAFPQASIDFRYDRASSLPLAERVLRAQGIDPAPLKHSALFDSDDAARIFLERSLGIPRANALLRTDVHLWYWHHRWFRPLQEEEYAADVAPTGELVAFAHRIPEARALPAVAKEQARAIAEQFLARNGVRVDGLQLVTQSERNLPHRVQRIFTYDARSVHPAGAPYRYTINVDGDVVSSYAQGVKVPEEWQRTYEEMRSKNFLAGRIDSIFLGLTAVAMLGMFIVRLQRRDIRLRLIAGIGIVTLVLTAMESVNSFPSVLAGYDTTQSFAAFLAQWLALGVVLPAIGSAIALMVLVGAGEVLYRERWPQHLALPRLVPQRALASKRVFRSLILGYTLVAFFIAYQVVFYLIADRFGAWSPAELPYDETLNSALPWAAVLFAGWFPALSEEFMSRAFSIPFLERLLRSRVVAVVAAAFIWGFGHATYPNQPFYIRGVEVGIAGVIIGTLLYRFGIVPLLVWHYTVDALYTALLLLRSHNAYYVFSGALAAFVFAVPMLLSIALYLRNKGFVPDADLNNATIPIEPVPPHVPREEVYELPPAMPLVRMRFVVCLVVVAIAAALIAVNPASPDDALDYRIARAQAKAIACAKLPRPLPRDRVIAIPAQAFRYWDRSSGREDGGSPGLFDAVAATYMLQHGLSVRGLADVFAHRIPAGTWVVRFFAPRQKDETFIEVDPRTARAIGYHRYQDERNAGPRLDVAQAQAIAMRAFAAYGADPSRFELKEALSFQQPQRLDWLFHFQERQPVVAEAYRRVSVRVAGGEVTQFATTVKIPDAAYRQAAHTSMVNVVLGILRLAAAVFALAIVVTGFVMAARAKRPPWLRAAKWTAPLLVLPIALALAHWESTLANYDTAIDWQTFLLSTFTGTAGSTGFQTGLALLAIAAILTIRPYAGALLTREARARFGRGAVVAALTTVAAFVAVRLALQLLANAFSTHAVVHGVGIPDEVATPFPAVFAAAHALLYAIYGCGAISLFAYALSTVRRRWFAPLATMAILFFTQLDSGVNASQLGLAVVSAAALAIAAWLLARHVLGTNPLAWPLALFSAIALQAALGMLDNHRNDLIVNGWALIAVVVAILAWLAMPSRYVERI